MIKGELVETITKDGLELKGFFVDAKSDTAVFHTHGTAGDFYSHKFLDEEGSMLLKSKFSFLSANNRGHDTFADIRKHTKKGIEWATIGGGFENIEESVLDIEAWVGFLKFRGIKKIILQGHSLGPNKNLLYISRRNDSSISGFIHLSPQNDAGLSKSILGDQKYKETHDMIINMLKTGRAKEILPLELSLVCAMSAFTYSQYFLEDGVANLFAYHNPKNKNWEILKSIKVPQILIFGESDPYMKPSINEAISVFSSKVYNKKLFTSQIIKNANHSYIGQEKELVNQILKWLKSNF